MFQLLKWFSHLVEDSSWLAVASDCAVDAPVLMGRGRVRKLNPDFKAAIVSEARRRAVG